MFCKGCNNLGQLNIITEMYSLKLLSGHDLQVLFVSKVSPQ